MITLAEAKLLKYGEVLIDERGKRWRVNGSVQTWKRDESRIRVPLKHGLYTYAALTDPDFDNGICNYMTREHPIQGHEHVHTVRDGKPVCVYCGTELEL